MLVPARLLAERDPLHERLRLRQRWLLVLKRFGWLPRWHGRATPARKSQEADPAVPATRRHFNMSPLVGFPLSADLAGLLPVSFLAMWGLFAY
jgi:hypothetical protein